MTAPVPSLFQPAPARPDTALAVRVATNAGPDGGAETGQSTGFAALLALAPSAPAPVEPALADPAPADLAPPTPLAAPTLAALAIPIEAETPGKPLPDQRPFPAATLAASFAATAAPFAEAKARFAAGAEPAQSEADPNETGQDQTAQPAAAVAATEPGLAPAALLLPGLALPVPAPVPAAAATPLPAAAPPPSALAQAATPQPATAQAEAARSPASGATHAAVVTTTTFVLEQIVPAAQPTATPPAGPAAVPTAPQVETAVRAEPSTLAALTGLRGDDQAAPRKPRSAAEVPSLAAARVEAATPVQTANPAALPFTPAPTPADGATPAPPAQSATAPISFDQLVDSIARARDSLANGISEGAPVAVAMRHAEFGRVSLSIQSDAAGLSVAMTSPDPAFAPAAAAAHAAATFAETPRAAPEPSRDATSGQTQHQRQGEPQAGTHQQHREAPRPPMDRAARANPSGAAAPAPERRGGIFA